MKKIFYTLASSLLIMSLLTAASPVPETTFSLVNGLPEVMNVGDTSTVIVHVGSNQKFLFAQALPSFQFVGKGVVAVQGGDHEGRGSSATLEVTFRAKSPTTRMPDGVAPVHLVLGVRYPGGYVAVQEYVFNVRVP
jgi:hypothetical protein